MIKVTFDKNVYEFVVEPEKPGKINELERAIYMRIHQCIIDRKIIPFISESILTYETLSKKDRQKILFDNQPLLISHDDGTLLYIYVGTYNIRYRNKQDATHGNCFGPWSGYQMGAVYY